MNTNMIVTVSDDQLEAVEGAGWDSVPGWAMWAGAGMLLAVSGPAVVVGAALAGSIMLSTAAGVCFSK